MKSSNKFLFIITIVALLLKPSDLLIAAKILPKNITPTILKSENYSALVINTNNGKVLYSRNANQTRYPASLTKMMTLYLTFEALQKGKLKMHQKLRISKLAASQPKSKLYLKKGHRISTQAATLGLIVKSANDAAVVLSEAIGGTQQKFVSLMNKKAKKLGMRNTRFQNPHGLHHPNQYTTANDMATLAIALKRDFRKYYHLFSRKHFSHKGRTIYTHNHILTRYKWVDGLKTGYVNASGYNLATSTNKKEGKLVAIVMGGQTARIRDNHMAELLKNSYAQLNIKNTKFRKKTCKINSQSTSNTKRKINTYGPKNPFCILDSINHDDNKTIKLATKTNPPISHKQQRDHQGCWIVLQKN